MLLCLSCFISAQPAFGCLATAGVNYGNGANGGVNIGSNSYITFGGGSTEYNGLAANNPTRPSIHIGSQDNSWKQVWAGASNGCYRWVAGRSWGLPRVNLG